MGEKQYSMKWKVIRILLLCWLIPFLFMIGLMGIYVGSNHSDMIALNYKEQMDFNSKSCVERINKAIFDSRQASYEGTILNVRREYEENRISYDTAHRQYMSYLVNRYQNNRAVSDAILWFDDGEEITSASVHNDKDNGSYQQIRTYWDHDHAEIQAYAQTLGTRIGFYAIDQKLYLVRNLVDNRYEVKAVLVFLLNKEYCFEGIYQFPMKENAAVLLNQEEPFFCGSNDKEMLSDIEYSEKGYRWEKGRLYLFGKEKGDNYHLQTVVRMQSSINMFPFFGYQYVIGGMLFSLFLMLLLVLWVFQKEVTTPVTNLIAGVTRIDQGELGYQIGERASNQEFAYLTDTVNRMSRHLEDQFTRIYQEEIALREARIMALQSHINPHFMNNTLETINWEARLGGNEKVSNMISALSKLLDSALDRRKRPQVTLREEMENVNAYLFIMKERLGDKLIIDDQIAGNLLSCQVPRLILQPLIENAIEHGVVEKGEGRLTLRGERKDDYLSLEIINSGTITQQEKEKIERLLKPDYNTSKESSGNLGIANVNQRLRILFGEPSGLSITEENGYICARILVPWNCND